MSEQIVKVGQYLPAKQASEILGYSITTLRTWAIEGRIPVILSPGGKYRYDVGTFLALAEKASKARLATEAAKLRKKRAKDAAAAAEKAKAKLEERRSLAAAQRAQKAPESAPMTDEPGLPF